MISSTDYLPVELGPDCIVDAAAIVGYRPGRGDKSAPTRIGCGGRVRAGSVIYGGVRIGDGFETGHNVVVREENSIGDDCCIWNNSTIDYGCVIGDRVKIHCNVYVAQYTTIEDDVFLAPGVTIANDPHPICTKCMQGPTIKRGARIGVGAILLPQIVIGENALVGSGSVVTADVPAGMLVMGNPARIVGPVDNIECAFGVVIPYQQGVDVRRRPEWSDVAVLPRPVARAPKLAKPKVEFPNATSQTPAARPEPL